MALRGRWAPPPLPRQTPPVGVGAGLEEFTGAFGGAVQDYAPIAFPGQEQAPEPSTITPFMPEGETTPGTAGLLSPWGDDEDRSWGALTPLGPTSAGGGEPEPSPPVGGLPGMPIGRSDEANVLYHGTRRGEIQAGVLGAPPLANEYEGDLTSGWEEFGNPALEALLVDVGFSPEAAAALCGPIAIASTLRAFGVDEIDLDGETTVMNPATIARDAFNRGDWNPGVGMSRGDGTSVAGLLDRYGVKNANLAASPDVIMQVSDLVDKGTPAVLNFPNHYMLAQDYNPETGEFFVGSTGSNALSGGADWMTLEQMAMHPGNGGPVESFIVPQGVPESAVALHSKKRFTASSASGEPQGVLPDTSSRDATVRSIEPLARYWEDRTNIPAEVFMAFNLHEGGDRVMAAPFGIKGSGTAGTQSQQTWEQTAGGVWQGAQDFAAYNDLNEAYDGFIELVSNPQGRYGTSWDYMQKTGDWRGWLRQINKAGYATDPVWGDKIAAFAENEVLPRMGQDPAVERPAAAPAPRGNAPAAGRGPGMAAPLAPARTAAAPASDVPFRPTPAAALPASYRGAAATTSAVVAVPAAPSIVDTAVSTVTGAVNDAAATVSSAADDVYTAVDDFLGGLW